MYHFHRIWSESCNFNIKVHKGNGCGFCPSPIWENPWGFIVTWQGALPWCIYLNTHLLPLPKFKTRPKKYTYNWFHTHHHHYPSHLRRWFSGNTVRYFYLLITNAIMGVFFLFPCCTNNKNHLTQKVESLDTHMYTRKCHFKFLVYNHFR